MPEVHEPERRHNKERREKDDTRPENEDRRRALDRRREAAREMIVYFKTTTLFSELGEVEIRRLLSLCRRRKIRAGEYVFWEGELGENLFFVLRGEIYLMRKIGEEEEFLASMKQGDTFGESGLLRGGIHTASALANSDSHLLVLEKRDFDEVDGTLSFKLMHNLALAAMEKLGFANHLIDTLYRQIHAQKEKAEQSKEEEKG